MLKLARRYDSRAVIQCINLSYIHWTTTYEHVSWLTIQVTPLSDCTFYHIYKAGNLIFLVCKYQVRDGRLYLAKSWFGEWFWFQFHIRASYLFLVVTSSKRYGTRYLTHGPVAHGEIVCPKITLMILYTFNYKNGD